MQTVRPFVSFDAAADPEQVRAGEVARLRTAATFLWLAMTPGFAFVRQRSNFILGWPGAGSLGSWMMLPDLTSPQTQTVLPMNDALYGAAHLELDLQGPFVVRLPPDTHGRYYSVSVMDAHFTNVAHLGPRWSGREEVEVFLVPPGWAGEVSPGMRVVEAPTPSVCLLNRVLVTAADGDLDRVRDWRSGFTLTPLDPAPAAADDHDLAHEGLATLTDPWRFLEIGYDHLRRNVLPEPARWAVQLVPESEVLAARGQEWSRRAVQDGIRDAQTMVDASLTTWPRENGWMLPQPWMGLPNPHVLETAALELFQVGFNDMTEATYFFGDLDEDGKRLDGTEGASYALTFSPGELPPVHAEGFWSVTMYGADNLLVANPAGRYSTRPAHPGFHVDPDGAVTIVLSASAPDGEDGPNWLPAPDGPFRLGLRLYYPTDAVLAGSWVPPAPGRVR
ncbi:DUF1254 domain-containing protein [Humibacillus xanthopallidus]|nr:DUF1254 domain-containing protein [Humibacillus xanthopallidus]